MALQVSTDQTLVRAFRRRSPLEAHVEAVEQAELLLTHDEDDDASLPSSLKLLLPVPPLDAVGLLCNETCPGLSAAEPTASLW